MITSANIWAKLTLHLVLSLLPSNLLIEAEGIQLYTQFSVLIIAMQCVAIMIMPDYG